MISPVITVRPFGKDITYLPPETQLLSASVICEQGNGSPGDPYQLCIQVKNDGDVPWRGVIRVSLPVDAPSPRFFLPGFMYGTNRGEAPLTVDSKCPRLREDGDFLASAWWMVRSDRLSQPCAFAYGNGRLTGFAAAPYYVRCDSWQKAWETGMRGEFDQYTGFGCSMQPGELWYTLGYENVPWFFLDSHQYYPRAPLDKNCFSIKQGETAAIRMYCFDILGDDERVLHDALKWVYRKYHEPPCRLCSVQQTVRDIASAVARDAWLPDKHTYSCFVFDKGDRFEYRLLPSIAWTNGLAATVPVLASSLRLNDETMRRQALDCIDISFVTPSMSKMVCPTWQNTTVNGATGDGGTTGSEHPGMRLTWWDRACTWS